MTDFDKALKALPSSAGFDAFSHKTVEDLCWICLHELDLVAEREYWQPMAERKKLLKFIETYGPSCENDYSADARKVFDQARLVTKSDCYIVD